MTRVDVSGPDLASAAAWAARLTPTKPTSPPMGGVVIEATDDGMSLAAYNYEVAGRIDLAATVLEPGRVLVSGRLLAAVTKTLGARDQASLRVDGPALELGIGKRQGWTLPTLDLRDYPRLPASPPPVAEVDGAVLVRALERTLPVVDPGQAYLAGVYLSGRDGRLTLAATDRYRLAVAEEIVYTPLDGMEEIPQVLIPGELLTQVVAAAREALKPVTLHIGTSGVGVSTETCTVIGRMIDETHVRWQSIALDEERASATVVHVRTAELRAAVERAAVVLDKDEALTLTIAGDTIAVEPMTGERGRAEHAAEALCCEGQEQVVGVSARYLRVALDLVSASQTQLRFTDRRWQPFLVRPLDEEGQVIPGYRHVIAQQRAAKR